MVNSSTYIPRPFVPEQPGNPLYLKFGITREDAIWAKYGGKTMDDAYTHSQIKSHWQAYKEAMAWQVLKNGTRTIRAKAPKASTEAYTSCQMVKVKDVMDFPTYLEKWR